MGKIVKEFETEYDVGDLVIFRKNKVLLVGIIEGYYQEDNSIWYNVRVSVDSVYTYSCGGDIPEFDIMGKITDDELKKKCLPKITIDMEVE